MSTKAKASKTKQAAKTAPKSAASKGQKKAPAATKEAGYGGKQRGHFNHPDGLKKGAAVILMIRKGKGMKEVTGQFQYCNRNSTEYGVIMVGDLKVERALSKFRPATAKSSAAGAAN